jgi:hypothetical protein
MRFIVSRLNAFITNRSGGVVFLIIQPQFHHHLLLGIFSYGALELSDKGSIEAVLGVAKATHNISNSADQGNSNGFFASIAYRADDLYFTLTKRVSCPSL